MAHFVEPSITVESAIHSTSYTDCPFDALSQKQKTPAKKRIRRQSCGARELERPSDDEAERQAVELPMLHWERATLKFNVGEDCVVNRETGKVHHKSVYLPMTHTACGWFYVERGGDNFIEELLVENRVDLTACGSCCGCNGNVALADIICTDV